jgi:hypothetical protein
MGRQAAPLERGGGPLLSQVSSPYKYKASSSLQRRHECFFLKERPLLGRRRAAKIKARPYQISVRIR